MRKTFFILMGPSGSGKGTQAKLLMKYLKNNTNLPLSYLSTGESFRKFIKKQNYTAKLTKDKLEIRINSSTRISYSGLGYRFIK